MGFNWTPVAGSARVTEVLPGSPAARSGLVAGDVILKVDDTELKIELTTESYDKFTQMVQGKAGTKLRFTVRHSGIDEPEVLELTREQVVLDVVTGELLHPLRAAINERLAQDPRNSGLLELRAELAGQWSETKAQLADYTAAIEALSEETTKATAAVLKRLYARRGNAHFALGQWQPAVDDYARGVTDATTDTAVLSNRARAQESLENWVAAAADWSRAATGNPQGAKLLAEFARRLAAVGQVALASGQFEKAQALFERSLNADPENDLLATDLAQLLLNKRENSNSGSWTTVSSVLKVTEPWSKLATAYAVNGRNDEALQYFRRALRRADGYEARRPILKLAGRFDDVLGALVQGQPDDSQLQLAWARKLAERGKQLLAEKQPAQALAEFQKAQEIFTRLRAEPQWTVLTPVEMKTESGAKLELQKDGSVFVHQPGNDDTFTLVFQTALKGIKGLRLEALADSRLPKGGPGWAANGNFWLTDLTLQAAPAKSLGQPKSIALANASADFSQIGWDVRGAIDSNFSMGWSIWPGINRDHTAVFELAEEVGDGQATRLTVRLNHRYPGDKTLLGRFRLSFTNDAATLPTTRIMLDLKESELIDLAEWIKQAQEKVE